MTQSFRILSIFILTFFALPTWAEDEEGATVPQAIYYAIKHNQVYITDLIVNTLT